MIRCDSTGEIYIGEVVAQVNQNEKDIGTNSNTINHVDNKLSGKIAKMFDAFKATTSKESIKQLYEKNQNTNAFTDNYRDMIDKCVSSCKPSNGAPGGPAISSDDDNSVLNVMSLMTRETNRHMLGSGVLSTSYYPKRMTNDPRNQRIDSVPFAPMAIHNHPNYNGMPGMGWFTVHANGHIVQTRHNDYRMYKKVVQGGKVVYVKNDFTPNVSGYDVPKMRELMSAYNTKSRNLNSTEKKLIQMGSYLS